MNIITIKYFLASHWILAILLLETERELDRIVRISSSVIVVAVRTRCYTTTIEGK